MQFILILSKPFIPEIPPPLSNHLLSLTSYVSCRSPSSGILQGSTLDPRLCLIFINDLPSISTSPYLLHTDDFKLFACVSSRLD